MARRSEETIYAYFIVTTPECGNDKPRKAVADLDHQGWWKCSNCRSKYLSFPRLLADLSLANRYHYQVTSLGVIDETSKDKVSISR